MILDSFQIQHQKVCESLQLERGVGRALQDRWVLFHRNWYQKSARQCQKNETSTGHQLKNANKIPEVKVVC